MNAERASSAKPALTLPSPPGGTMQPESPYYIERDDLLLECSIDRRAVELASLKGRVNTGVTCCIRAPRQFGKSSLLSRMARLARTEDRQIAMIDFTTFDSSSLVGQAAFFQAFTARVLRSLGLSSGTEALSGKLPDGQDACTEFFKQHIFPSAPDLFLAMDEVDLVLEAEFSVGFFAMLRNWHNWRGEDVPGGVSLCLVTATEPNLFIKNHHQSPFNVSTMVRLRDFSEEESGQLYRRYDAPVSSAHESALFRLLEGHPYLTHVAAYYLTAGVPAEMLLSPKHWETSPFSDHLRNYAYRLLEKRILTETFRLASKGKACQNIPFTFLEGMGLVDGTSSKPRVRRELYRLYYSKVL